MNVRKTRLQAVQRLIDSRFGGVKSAFARAIEMTPQEVGRWFVASKHGRPIHEDTARRIEVRLGLPKGSLDTEPGPQSDSALASGPSADIPIPRLAVWASMGPGIEIPDDEHVVEHMTLSRSWVAMRLPRLSSAVNLRVIAAYGDSMAPTFSDGDLLLVDSGVRAVDLDGVFVLSAQGRLFIKRVRQRLDGTFVVSSDNPAAGTPEELSGTSPVQVQGRVVWAWNGRRL